jgi:hypothetical protein
MKGTKYNRVYFQLVPKTLRTEGNEFGLLPTMTASDSNGIKNLRKDSNIMEGGRHSVSLTHMFHLGMLPTPNASDNRDLGGPKDKCVQRRMEIGKQVGLTQMVDGQLNPQFVEEMMGFPIGWTDLKHWETQ